MIEHQYIERATSMVRTEALAADPVINTIYSNLREKAGLVFDLLISRQMSALLGALAYDFPFRKPIMDPKRFLKTHGIDLTEVEGDPRQLDSYRKIFERRIRYWELRPMTDQADAVLSPADARLLMGSFSETKTLFIKDKFFDFRELISPEKQEWFRAFFQGDFAVCRLTPEKYHYNHSPVAGMVLDIYEVNGKYHSCNPGAVVRAVTPYSKNRRVVTIIDTDVPGGTNVGLVAMVEVVAMMIGRICQCYSRDEYQNPVPVTPGLFMEKGAPKSLFRPGSSTTILIFEKGRVEFSQDLLRNQRRRDAQSRFSQGFDTPLVETEVQVRSPIARAGCGLGQKDQLIKEA